MTDDRPAPLVPPDLDCTKLPKFMLDVERVLASELWALSTGEEYKAAHGLYYRAWKQTPAASLPNDERLLAIFAGVSPARWPKVRAMAMRGFVLCSDGRWYHKTLAAEAIRAHGYHRKREAENERLRAWRGKQRGETRGETDDETRDETDGETRGETVVKHDDETVVKRVDSTGQDKTGQKEGKQLVLRTVEVDSPFQTFWDVYPRKVARKDAEKSFHRIIKNKEATGSQLIAGAERYAEMCRLERKEKQFIKLPATWLNKGCWSDEDVPEPARNGVVGAALGIHAALFGNGTDGTDDHEN